MAAAATMAAAARELVLRAGTSDMEEEEGPLVRARGCFSSVVPMVLASERSGLGLGTSVGAWMLPVIWDPTLSLDWNG
uniref:VPS52 subunit of GARP complex n=1 Tax=Propithecus coquereli TaxID=379532 RepID=A0A2K6GVX7_PROCO